MNQIQFKTRKIYSIDFHYAYFDVKQTIGSVTVWYDDCSHTCLYDNKTNANLLDMYRVIIPLLPFVHRISRLEGYMVPKNVMRGKYSDGRAYSFMGGRMTAVYKTYRA